MANVTVSKLSDGTNTGYFASQAYFTCSTAAATAAKVATDLTNSLVFSDTSLVTGVTVHVKFTYSNTAASPSLKVGTSTAKTIMRYGTTSPSTSVATSWEAGAVISFTYDGTYWQMNDAHVSTDVTQNASISLNMDYPVLLGASDDTTAVTGPVNKAVQLWYNPSLNKLNAPYIVGNIVNGSAASYYATSSSTSTTSAALVATISPAVVGFTLKQGSHVFIPTTASCCKFISLYSYTLNVNSTGAKGVYYRGQQLGSGLSVPSAAGTALPIGLLLDFVYDGQHWNLVSTPEDDYLPDHIQYCTDVSLSAGTGGPVYEYGGDTIINYKYTWTASSGGVPLTSAHINMFSLGILNSQASATNYPVDLFFSIGNDSIVVSAATMSGSFLNSIKTRWASISSSGGVTTITVVTRADDPVPSWTASGLKVRIWYTL